MYNKYRRYECSLHLYVEPDGAWGECCSVSLAHNYFNFYLEFGCYHSNLLHGTTQVITSLLLRLRAINNGKRETIHIQLPKR